MTGTSRSKGQIRVRVGATPTEALPMGQWESHREICIPITSWEDGSGSNGGKGARAADSRGGDRTRAAEAPAGADCWRGGGGGSGRRDAKKCSQESRAGVGVRGAIWNPLPDLGVWEGGKGKFGGEEE